MVHLSFVIEMVWRCGGVRECDEVTVFVRLHNMVSGNFGCPHTTDNTVLAVFLCLLRNAAGEKFEYLVLTCCSAVCVVFVVQAIE
jgi:hypothetical protein